jgi:hypothetical protein
MDDEDWEIDMIDRLLEQGDEIELLEPQYETWAAELRERKGTLEGELSPRAASTRGAAGRGRRKSPRGGGRGRRGRQNNASSAAASKRSSPRPGRSAGSVLPAWITDSSRWHERMAEKGRRRRLKQMKSTFERFPEVRKHLYTQSGGRHDSHKPRKALQGERLRTQAWNSERLRKQLRRSAKKVLRCCSDDYVRKTHKTQFLIELNRAAMSSKVTLHRLVPSSSQDGLAGIDADNGFQEMADIMAGEKSPQQARNHRLGRTMNASPTTSLQDDISQHLLQKSSMEREAMLAALLEDVAL